MSDRWVDRLLRLAPEHFRRRYGAELRATYESRARAAAEQGRLRSFQTRELLGMAWLVLRLRVGRGASTTAAPPIDHRTTAADGLLQDVRSALRGLRRNPGFSLAAIAVLALGVGATSAIFSAANAYFFRPLPFAEPERLVTVFETNPEFGWVDATAAPANLLDWREQVEAFEDVSGYSDVVDQIIALRDGEPTIVTGTEVLGNFFSTLGVRAALGRSFQPEETWLGQDDVVVLSHDLWVTQFGSDPDIVGKSFEFATHSPQIIGVMPEGFRFPDDGIQLWYPMGWDRDAVTNPQFRRAHYVRAFARLAPGVASEDADAELQAVVRGLQEQYPETNSVMGAGIMPMRDFLTRDVRTSLNVLLGAVAFLLLLACTNVANLMLVRAAERSREVAVRRALGANRRRLLRHLLAESAVLALAGGGMGLVLGWLAIRALGATTPLGIGGATSVSLDVRVVLVTFAAAATSGALFSVAPALRAATGEPGEALSPGTRGSTAARSGLRTAGLLVSVQVALALLLVVGAALMIRTFWTLRHVDPGFRTDGVLAVQFAVQTARYPERDGVLAFYDAFAEALEARPDIRRVGTVAQLPLAGQSWSSQFQAEGWAPDRVGFEILHRRADAGYFEALEIPLVAGRMFAATDGPDTPPVVLINESFARAHFPGESAVGQRIAFARVAGPGSRWHEIIGIVGDQHQESLATSPRPEVFENRNQDWGRNGWTVVRGDGEADALLPTVRAVLREIDPLIPIARVRTLTEVRSRSMAREQLVLTLLSAFGVVALLLAAVGVYGVTSRAARRRVQEIGIRMALGARGGDVVRLMVGRGLVVVALGLIAGLGAALLATRALSSLLFGVEPTDAVTLVAVVSLLGTVALVACYVPARRASTADPLAALRSE